MTQLVRVLHVDDSTFDRQLVRDSLEKEHLGFVLTEAVSRKEFEALLAEDDFDIVLSDFNILGFDGLQVIEAIKAKAPLLPVVLVTGTGSEEIAVEAMKRGAADYVIKSPSHIKRLPQTIQAVLEKKRLEKQHEQDERLLKESEERFRLLYEHAPIGYQSLDENGLFIEVNQTWVDLLGYSSDEVIGKWFGHFVAPAWEEHFEKNFLCLKAAGEIYGAQFDMIRKNGSTVTVEFDGKIGYDRAGNFKQTHCVLRDITAQRRAEVALRESEEAFRSLFENSLDATLLTAPDGTVFRANPAACEMFGMTEEEICRAGRERLVDTADSRLPVLLEERRVTGGTSGELNFRRKDGTVFPAEVSSSIFVDAKGQQKTSMSIRDISERKYAEKALHDNERFLSDIFLSIQDGITVLDTDLTILRVNATMEHWYQHSMPLVGRKCHEAYHGKSTPCEICPTRQTIASGRPEHAVIPRSGPSGEIVRWLDLFSFPLVEAQTGNLKGIIEYVRDITDQKNSELVLRQSEEKYRTIFENAPIGIYHFDNKGVITACNDTFVSIIGSSREKLVGLNTISDTKNEHVINAAKDALSIGIGTYVGDYASVTAEKVTPVRAEFRALPAPDGSVAGGIAIVEDLSARKRAEDALKQSEEKYRLLVENASDGIVVVQDEVLRFLNDRAGRMLGYEKEEVLEKPFAAFIHPDDQQIFVERHRQRLSGTDLPTRYPFRIVRKSGDVRWCENAAVLISWENKPATLVVMTDIHDRRKEEEARLRLSTAAEQAAEAIIVTDTTGSIQYVNPAFERISGYTREQVIGNTPRMWKSDEHDTLFYKDMWDTITSGHVWSGRIVNKKSDGSLFTEEATISPVRDSDGVTANYVAVKRDITGEIQLQRQLVQAQRMESIGTLAGGIAHDFNNLLQVVLGYSDMLLLDRDENAGDCQELKAIHHAARRGADLVKQILTFSTKMEINPRPLNLNRQVNEAQKLLNRTIPKMIEIELLLAEDLKTTNADPGQIEQALLNLVVNARDAMPEWGKLTIATRNASLDEEFCRSHVDVKPGEYVVLEVSDTGHGMEKDVVDHIFEPFYTTKGPGEGTGLGLAMVYGIVKTHNGVITCYSEPGIGTSFKIYLPAITLDETPKIDKIRIMSAFGTETILLVDDEDLIKDLGEKILARSGYTVLTASDGKEALEIYEKKKSEISLVILDVVMPLMGGKECLIELLRMNPNVKVIIASGFALDGPARETIEAGAKGIVSKPFNIGQLLQTVRTVLDAD